LAPLHQIECGITKGASTVGGLHPIGFGFGGTFGNTLTGADALLSGETDGMASDFTRSDGTGYVSVLDTATPANVVSNVIADAWWTNSGTSPKLINTSAGALAWSPHNMVLQSQTLSTSWTTTATAVTDNDTAAPDGTTTAEKLVESNTSNSVIKPSSAITVALSTQYTASGYVKPSNNTWLALNISDTVSYTNASVAWFDIVNGTVGTQTTVAAGAGFGLTGATIASAGSGWYRISVTFTVPLGTTCVPWFHTATADASTTRVTSGTYWLWGAQLNRGPTPTAYLATTTAARYGLGIDYSGGSYGLLVEPAATNLRLRSQEFDNASWSKSNTSVSANSTAAPDGEIAADTVTATAGTSAAKNVNGSQTTLSTSTNYTLSIYAKKGTHNYFSLAVDDATDSGKGILVDLNAGTILSTALTVGSDYTYVGSSIASLANGWYRISITVSWAAGGGTTAHMRALIRPDGSDTTWDPSWTAAGTETVYLWGAQFELGTVATSHIPTFAATVTRASDAVNAAASTAPAFTTELSLWAYGQAPVATAGTFFNGSSTNEFAELYLSTGPIVGVFAQDGGATQANFTAGSFTLNTDFKAAARFKANDFHAAVGGTLSGAPDTSGTMCNPLNLRIGYTHLTATVASRRIKQVRMLPRAYSNAELQSTTA
jgi:hypothetical protein